MVRGFITETSKALLNRLSVSILTFISFCSRSLTLASSSKILDSLVFLTKEIGLVELAIGVPSGTGCYEILSYDRLASMFY
jgi:hypothetical protein